MSNKKITGKELILKVLESAKKPLSVSDIWEIAEKKGYAKLYGTGNDAKQKEAQIGAEISRWCQKGDSPLVRFEKGKKGRDITYSLNDKEEIEDNGRKNEIVVKDLYAEGCGPCKIQTPIIKDLEKQYERIVKFEIIDIDKNEKIAEKYKIRSIPTVIIEKNGIVVKRHVGVVSKKELIKELDKLLMKD